MNFVQHGPKMGWVLYDDSCGFCRRWIPFWAPTLHRRGYDFAPLQTAWVRKQLDPSSGPQLDDLRLLLSDGTQIQGANVYRHLMRRIWWACPIYFLACLPGLRQIFDWSYKAFARNRFRFSKACGLGVRTDPPSDKP